MKALSPLACMLLPLAGLLGLSCGPPTAAKKAAPPSSPPLHSSQWVWEDREQNAGVLRVDHETWHFATDAGHSLSGTILRSSRFVSTDGAPFACIQGQSYQLRARYRFRGTRRGAALEIEETGVEVAPSPCEPGTRPLRSYRGQRRGSVLDLRYALAEGEQGQQSLRRHTGPALPRHLPKPMPIAGAWHWQTQQRRGDTLRTETERWLLEEEGGLVSGHYMREVKMQSLSKQDFPCAQSDHYSFQDTYFLRGRLKGRELSLQEHRAQSEAHACVPQTQRVLDGGRALLYPDALVIEWRGKRVQVLRPLQPAVYKSSK